MSSSAQRVRYRITDAASGRGSRETWTDQAPATSRSVDLYFVSKSMESSKAQSVLLYDQNTDITADLSSLLMHGDLGPSITRSDVLRSRLRDHFRSVFPYDFVPDNSSPRYFDVTLGNHVGGVYTAQTVQEGEFCWVREMSLNDEGQLTMGPLRVVTQGIAISQ